MILRKKIDLLQRYQERIERLSQQDRMIKFCSDAGFLTTVEVGQYFMTKDTEEFEYTVPRDEKSSDPKGWIRGNTKIGPVLEVTTSYLQGKYGVDIRIESVTKDTSHSWIRISHGLNKLVTDLSNNKEDNNEQETSEMQFENFAFKTNVLAFASRSKANAKPQRRTPASSSTIAVPIGERKWSDIEPEDYSPITCPVSKQLSTLLRHGSLPREEDGAIEFWRLKDYLRNDFVRSQHWSDEMWKSTMARGGGNQKSFQYCTDSSGQEILYLRALQGHSGRSLIDPSLQDNVIIPDGFFEYIYHVGCAINLHSIINSGLIPGGQNLSNRQTLFFTSVDPMNKEHNDPGTIDLEAPRLAQYLQTAWKKHQNTVYWVDIKLAQRKGFKFYQTRSNAIILHDTLPAYCIPKAIMMGTGEITNEKENASPRLPPRISFKDNWMKELGSEVARGGKDSQQTQPKTKNPIVRTGRRPVLAEQPSSSSAQEIDKRVLFDCESTNLRSGRDVSSCVPVSVERLDQDKDADENVDADHVRTGRTNNPSVCSHNARKQTLTSECLDCHMQL